MADLVCAWCAGPFTARRDARCCSPACKARDRYRRDRERAKSDPAFAEVLRARGRSTASAWARRHPDRAREKNARRDYAANARKWREAHPEHFTTPEYRERANRANAKHQQQPEVREQRRQRQQARRAGSRTVLRGLVVLESCDGVCGICGGDVDPSNFHIDHVIPLARGGDHSYANVQVAHPECNLRKGDRL